MVEERNVPQIRFKGFTEPWEQRQFTDSFRPLGSNTLPRSKMSEIGGGYLNIHYGDLLIRYSSVLDVQNDVIPCIRSEVVARNLQCPPLEDGDVVFADTAEDTTAGKAVEVRRIGDRTIYSGLHTMPYRPKNEFARGFLGYYLNSGSYRFQMIPLMQGIKVISISKTAIATTTICFPTQAEQRPIGYLLESLESLITLHQRKLDRLKSVKKSLLEKMFPKPDSDVPEIRFVGFTDPWEQCQLGDTVEVCSGRDYKHLPAGRIPVYGTGGYMTSVSAALSYARDAVGIGRKGTIDRPYKLVAPFWTVDTLFFSIPREGNDLDFLLGVFLRIDWKSKNEATGLPSLSKQTINEIEVFIPEATEQSRIGHVFAKLDNLITLHQRKLDILGRIKKSLLEKMFV